MDAALEEVVFVALVVVALVEVEDGLASVVAALEVVVGAASTAAGTAVVEAASEAEEVAATEEAAALLDLTRQREVSDLRLSFFGLTTCASRGAATGTGSGAALRAARA